MCRHATCELPPVPESAHAARRFLGTCAEEWDLLPLVEDAQLALTELVTNAVLHGEGALTVSVSCAGDVVEIAVFDGSPALPTARPHRHDLHGDLGRLLEAEARAGRPLPERDPLLHIGDAGPVVGGRGLLLVEALSAEWGVSPLSTGKAVWIRSSVPKDWPHSDGCACDADQEGSVALASGGRVIHRSD